MNIKTLLVTIMPLIFSLESNATSNKLSPYGYESIRTGMTLSEAQTTLSLKFILANEQTPYDVNNDCQSFILENHPPELIVMVVDGIIERISIYEDIDNQHKMNIKTDTGLTIHDSAKLIHERYPVGLKNEPHEYLGPAARYLTWWDKEKDRGIRFETDMSNRITAIHAGSDAIFLLEGCS